MRSYLKLLAVALAFAPVPSVAVAQYLSVGVDFLKAVRDRDGNKVTELLGADGSTVVNYRDDKGEAALHVVTARRDTEYLAYFLSKRADPNIQTNAGNTPLMAAARIGYLDGINLLLRVGAKVDLANKAGETPLIIAVQQRQPQAVKRLLEAGANPDRADNATGRSAREYAKLDRRNAALLQLIETVKPAKPKAVAGPKL